MKTIKVLITTLFLFVSLNVKATAVIVILYPDRILLGADSRIAYSDNKTGKRTFNTGCKIYEANNTVYAFAGYAGVYGDYARLYNNFNTQLFIKGFLERRDKPLLQNLKDLEKGLKEELANQFRIMQKVDQRKYLIEKKKGNPLNLIVLGNNNGKPFACGFVATFNTANDKIEINSYLFQNITEIIHFGTTEAVSKYKKAHPSLLKDEPVSLLDKLMTEVISDKPLDVGGPVNIVEVTGKGINWIRRNGCGL